MATVAEMQARMDEIAGDMTRTMLRYAQNLLETGTDKRFRTMMEAYKDAGYKGQSNSNNPSRVAADPRIKEYVDLGKKLVQRAALESLEYDEAQWLHDAVTGINMALGRLEMIVTAEQRMLDRDTGEMNTVFEERQIKSTDLKSAARYTEILGKKLGLLVEKKLHGEDPKNPLNSLRELANLMGGIAQEAQEKGPVRNG